MDGLFNVLAKPICSHLPSSEQLWCIEEAIKRQQNRFSLLSVSDSVVKITNLLPFTCTEIHINFLLSEFSENLIDLKLKVRPLDVTRIQPVDNHLSRAVCCILTQSR